MTARLDLLNSVLGNRVAADATRNPRAAGTASIPAALSITLDRIDADPDQPRREFVPEDLDQLAASIRQLGVLQPIIVRYVADRDRYVVMDGERRLRASRQAKMSSIPCVVNDRELTADRIMQLQLVANALRCDLSPLEAARAYQSLQVAWACSRKDLASQLNISESKLSRTMAILDLPGDQQQAIAIGNIAPTAAVQRARVKPATVKKRAGRPKAITIRTPLGDVVLTPKRADVQLIDLLQAAIHQLAKGEAA